MSASGFTPIQLYRSSTAATLPVAGNLAPGELAINTTDEKLYFENTGGTVTLLASSAATGGTFTTVTATTVVNGLGAVGTPSYTFTGDLNTGMWSPAADTVAVSTAGLERLRVTSAGNVGIGTNAPGALLDVNGVGRFGGTPSIISVGLNGDSISSNGDFYVQTSTANPLILRTNFAEVMRLTSAGLVGIGTSAPATVVDASFSGGMVRAGGAAGNNLIQAYTGSVGLGMWAGGVPRFYSTGSMIFSVNSTIGTGAPTGYVDALTIDSAGNVGIGVTPSGSWGSPALMLGKPGASNPTYPFITSPETQQIVVGSNSYWDGTNWRAAFAGAGVVAMQQRINYNKITWHTAAAVSQGSTQTFTQAMTLDESGNLLVGTTSALGVTGERVTIANNNNCVLSIVATNDTTPSLQFRSNSVNRLAIDSSSNFGAYFNVRSNQDIRFGTNDTERMRITAAGLVGIGTSAPEEILDIRKDTSGTRLRISTSDNGNVFYAGWRTGASFIAAAGYNSPVLAFDVGGSERMRIDGSGNVGIGTTTPTGSIGGGYNSRLTAYAAANAAIDIKDVNGNWFMGTTAGAFTLYSNTASAERMRIDSSGNVLVGCTTTGFAGGTNTGIYLTNNTGGSGGLHIINNSNNTSANVATFYGYNGSQTGSIATFVNTTNYNTSSDARLKENIADADDAASLIDAIKVRKFDWKLDNSHQRYGMVAQELVTVAPEAVSQQAHPDDLMGVDYSKLVPMLIKALQELTARVAQLEGK